MKKIILGTLFVATTMFAMAVPARRDPIEVRLADNSTVTLYPHGDEFFHYFTTEDGTWVQLNEAQQLDTIEALTDEEIMQKRVADKRFITQKETPLNIAPRGLVILVNFNDLEFQAENTRDAMDAMFNSSEYSYAGVWGSVRDYFSAQSFGKYQPQFDVVGPVTVSNGWAYYGKDTNSGDDVNVDEMVKEACDLADAAGVDFSLYDNDNDGEVDFVYFYYAGYGQAETLVANQIWPHSSRVKGRQNIELDGKVVDLYACSSELTTSGNNRAGINTFCHEFSHVLGLPDLYYTGSANLSHKTMGKWDIMDYGPYNNDGRTPPAYSSYERFFMGWMTPVILNSPKTVVLNEINRSRNACIITSTGESNLVGNDPVPSEFYMLENRQLEGYDAYLPGHGMMLTKVKYSYTYWDNNTVNNVASDQRVDLIEANGKAPNYSIGKASDLFPNGGTSYTPYEEYPITNVKEIEVDGSNIIVFDFMGGGDSLDLATENIFEQEERVVAIYNIMGQLQSTTDMTQLPQGYYIVCTNKRARKMFVR